MRPVRLLRLWPQAQLTQMQQHKLELPENWNFLVSCKLYVKILIKLLFYRIIRQYARKYIE